MVSSSPILREPIRTAYTGQAEKTPLEGENETPCSELGDDTTQDFAMNL